MSIWPLIIQDNPRLSSHGFLCPSQGVLDSLTQLPHPDSCCQGDCNIQFYKWSGVLQHTHGRMYYTNTDQLLDNAIFWAKCEWTMLLLFLSILQTIFKHGFQARVREREREWEGEGETHSENKFLNPANICSKLYVFNVRNCIWSGNKYINLKLKPYSRFPWSDPINLLYFPIILQIHRVFKDSSQSLFHVSNWRAFK